MWTAQNRIHFSSNFSLNSPLIVFSPETLRTKRPRIQLNKILNIKHHANLHHRNIYTPQHCPRVLSMVIEAWLEWLKANRSNRHLFTHFLWWHLHHTKAHTQKHTIYFQPNSHKQKKKPSEHTIGLRNNKWASICAQFAHNTLLVVPNQQLSVEKKMYTYISRLLSGIICFSYSTPYSVRELTLNNNKRRKLEVAKYILTKSNTKSIRTNECKKKIYIYTH